MTFSDAEEDHPSNGRNNARPPPRRGGSTDSGQQDSTSQSRTESGMSNASTASPTIEPPNPIAATAPITNSLRSAAAVPTTNSLRSTAITSSMASSNRSSRVSSRAASSISPAAAAAITATNSANNMVTNEQVIDSEKLIEKLQQIQGYINQTAAAMEALEQEGDMTKINQYNTLVKIMRDLKSSEGKLQEQLNAHKDGSKHVDSLRNGTSVPACPANACPLPDSSSRLLKQAKEKLEVENSSSRFSNVDNGTTPSTLVPDKISNGMVVSNGNSHPSVASTNTTSSAAAGEHRPHPLTMHERLTRSQEEADLITAKMRDSIGRREELMSRYKATRERLVNLKKQRKDLLQDERRVLHDSGASESTYEDPIPGAETWTLEQLGKAIEDFRGLYDKIDDLQNAYTAKAEALDPTDEAERNEVAVKLEQLMTKRRQLIEAITQLKGLQTAKRAEQGLPELEDDSNQSSNAVTESHAAPEPDSTHITEGRTTPPNCVNNEPTSDDQVTLFEPAVGDVDEDYVSPILLKRNPELAAQHEQLDFLKNQLSNMKKLLDVAKADRMKEEKLMLERKAEMERRMAAVAENRPNPDETSIEGPVNALSDSNSDDAEHVISGISGASLMVTEEELRDPEVLSKYKQLAEAKKRLNKMEDVMMMIAEAQRKGQSINEALSPEYLAILEDAKNEVEQDELREPQQEVPSIQEQSPREVSLIREQSPREVSLIREQSPKEVSLIREQSPREFLLVREQPQREVPLVREQPQREVPLVREQPQREVPLVREQPQREVPLVRDQPQREVAVLSRPSNNTLQIEPQQQQPVPPTRHSLRTARMGSGSPAGTLRTRSERASSVRAQENKEISAMERNLNKRIPRVSSVNEGPRLGHEKGAIKKQPQAMWRDEDPRVAEALALQEELRQKKNTFEALVRGMGKPSSFNVDNISDNISDNVSETSERLETTTATWGTVPGYSENHNHRSSDDELVDEDDDQDTDAAAILQPSRSSHRRYNLPLHTRASLPPKDRNRHIEGRAHRHEGSSTVSVNNLASASSRSVKPKHNKLRGSSVPNTSWDRAIHNPRDRNYKSPSNNTLQAHNTLNSALQQLSQVQDTINSLYETVNNEQNSAVNGGLSNAAISQNYMPRIPPPPSSLLGNYPVPSATPNFGGISSYLTALASQGVGNASTGASGDLGNSNTLLTGLQQCFSQLYLHSLEIQALSKHVQVRPPTQVNTPYHPYLSSFWPPPPPPPSPFM